MKVSELASKFRARVRDITGDESERLFTDDEIIGDYAQEARTDLFRNVRSLLIDSTTVKDADDLPLAVLPIIANQALYPMSPKIIQTTRFQLDSQTRPLPGLTMDELDRTMNNWQNMAPGTPIVFCTDYQTDAILLVPTPLNDDTARLSNRIYPLADLTATSPDDDLGFRSEYHKDLLPKMLALAFAKTDSQCYRPELVPVYEEKFLKRCDEIKLEMYRRQNGSHTNRCHRAFTSK